MESKRRKSVRVAILCNLLLTGAGYMYMGRVVLGIGALLFVLAVFAFNPFAGIFTWLALEVVMAIDMLILAGGLRFAGKVVAKAVVALVIGVPVLLLALYMARSGWQDYARKSGNAGTASKAALVAQVHREQSAPSPAAVEESGSAPDAASKPAELTRDTVAAIVSGAETFRQMKARDLAREVVAVDGVVQVSASEKEAPFRWRYVLDNPRDEYERTIAQTESRAVATLTLYDDGWRLIAIRDAEATNAKESSSDLRLLEAVYARAMARVLGPRRGDRAAYTPPRTAEKMRLSIPADVYGDMATALYYRADCERPKAAVRMLPSVAKINGYKPAPSCYGVSATAP